MAEVEVAMPYGTKIEVAMEVDVGGHEVSIEMDPSDLLTSLQSDWSTAEIVGELDEDDVWEALSGSGFEPTLSDEQLLQQFKDRPDLLKLALSGDLEEETFRSRSEVLIKGKLKNGRQDLLEALELLVREGKYRVLMQDVLGKFHAGQRERYWTAPPEELPAEASS